MESSTAAAVCKVIVQDSDADCELRIKQFCDDNNLVAVRSHASSIMEVLRSNVDLGAIFLSDDAVDDEAGGRPLCQSIQKVRPELPIMMRLTQPESLAAKACFTPSCISYDIDSIDSLRSAINEHIFNSDYPNALIRGIKEITNESLTHLFPGLELETSLPYLIKDRIIYGELFSLIPLESSWCRGYMMLQTDQKHIIDLVKKDIVESYGGDDFRQINDVLSEITNMVWGKIKSRFISGQDQASQFYTQVPIIVNHQNKYITFGTNAPQLCFRYRLSLPGDSRDVTLYQKFIFNLNWDPEKFSENQPTVDDLLESGELEFF
jgi:CheY-specific phosphatase CheX